MWIVSPQQTKDELEEDIVRVELEELKKELNAEGIHVMTAEEEAALGIDYSDIPTMWQWRFVLLRDGTLRLYEIYWNGARIVGYSEESQLFDDGNEHDACHCVDAYTTVSKAMGLPVLHVDQLPKFDEGDDLL